MGAAVLAVALLLCAQVETGTNTATSTAVNVVAPGVVTSTLVDSLDALLEDLGDDPLTSAELDLLARVRADTATAARTASIAWPSPSPALRPVYRTTQRGRRETVARSTREALEALAVPAVSFRLARRRVLYEGMLLAPLAEGVLDADVRMFDRVELSASGSRRDHSTGAGGTIALYGATPEVGIHPEAAVEARSADRSTGVYGAIDGGVESVRARAAIGYDDTRALRAPDGPEPRNAGQRWLASVRGVLFGAEGDLVRVTAGGDVDRALNTRIADDDGEVRGVARLDQRALGFARVEVGSERWGISLTGGYQGLRQELVLDEVAVFDIDGDLFQGRLSAFAVPLEWLRLEGGLHVAFGSGSAPQEITRREIEGYLFGSLLFDRVQAELGLRIAHQRSEIDFFEVSGLRPLPQAALHFTIAGPLGLRAAFDMGMTVPGGGLFAPGSSFRSPETTVTLEAGPTLRGASYWANLVAFSSWIQRPLLIAPDLGTASPRSLRALGFELDGAFAILANLDLAFTVSLAEAVDRDTGRAAYFVPLVSGLIALRYRFDLQNAHVEVRARAASGPFELIGDEPLNDWELDGERPKAFVRAGISGGLDLGAGFALDLAVENAFDRRHRLHTSGARGGGLDVRAALSWRW